MNINSMVACLFSIESISILFLFGAMILIYYFKTTRVFLFIAKKRWVQIFFNILFGIIFASLNAFFYYFQYNFFNNEPYQVINVLVFSVIAFSIFWHLSKVSGISFIIFSLVPWGVSFHYYNEFYFLILLYGIIATGICLVGSGFIKNFLLSRCGPMLLLVILVCIFAGFSETRSYWYFYLFTFLLTFFSYLNLFIGRYVYRLFVKTVKIKESAFYSDKYYINHAFAKDSFYNFVKENNVQIGYLVMVDVDNHDLKHSVEFAKWINKSMDGRKILFFKTKNNSCFFFIKKESADNDQKITEINDKIFSNFINHKIPANFLITKYGIDSCLFDELLSFCRSQFKKELSYLSCFYEPLNQNLETIQKQKVIIFKKILPFEKINISFVSKKYDDKTFIVPKILYPTEMNAIDMQTKYRSDINTIQRMISTKIATDFIYSRYLNYGKLLLPYPFEALNSTEFSIDRFTASFINCIGRNYFDKIILAIDYKEQEIKPVLFVNIANLQQNGIEVASNSKVNKQLSKVINYSL